MEAEHCSLGKSHDFFETAKNRKTCPEHEWAITVRSDYTHIDPSSSTRKLRSIEDLMKLDVVKHANLIRCEVIAVVLYTGPMVSCMKLIHTGFRFHKI